MFGWHPWDSELGFNSQAQDWFFEYGSTKRAQLKIINIQEIHDYVASELKTACSTTRS